MVITLDSLRQAVLDEEGITRPAMLQDIGHCADLGGGRRRQASRGWARGWLKPWHHRLGKASRDTLTVSLPLIQGFSFDPLLAKLLAECISTRLSVTKGETILKSSRAQGVAKSYTGEQLCVSCVVLCKSCVLSVTKKLSTLIVESYDLFRSHTDSERPLSLTFITPCLTLFQPVNEEYRVINKPIRRIPVRVILMLLIT